MFLVSVKAKYFQGYRNLEIDLEGGPACIVGANMSGKSSAGRAILWCCTGSFPYPKDMGRITKEMVHPDDWSELSPSKRRGLATIVETVFYIYSENGSEAANKKYYCITRTQALSKSSSSLVLQEFDPDTGVVSYKFTGAEAQKIIYSLAKITGDTAKENAKMFFRTHWLGVGQETSFFYATGSQRRDILETINPQTTLVKMHKEASARLKTKKTLEGSTETDFAIVRSSLENSLTDLSARLAKISGQGLVLEKIEASLTSSGLGDNASLLSKFRSELSDKTNLTKVVIDKYLESKKLKENDSINDQIELVSSLNFDDESRGFADLHEKFSNFFLKAGQIRKEFANAGVEFSKIVSLKNEISALSAETEELRKSADANGNASDLGELLLNLTETAENLRLLQESDTKTQKIINSINSIEYRQKELNNQILAKKSQKNAVDDVQKFFESNNSEDDIIKSSMGSQYDKAQNEPEPKDLLFYPKLATNLLEYFSKYTPKEFTEALRSGNDSTNSHSRLISSLSDECKKAKEEIAKISNQYLNQESKKQEQKNRLNEYESARNQCIKSANSIAGSWQKLTSGTNHQTFDEYVDKLKLLTSSRGHAPASEGLDQLLEKASNIRIKTGVEPGLRAAYTSLLAAKYKKIESILTELEEVGFTNFYKQHDAFKEVFKDSTSKIEEINAQVEKLKASTAAQQYKISHVSAKLSKQDNILKADLCEECGQEVDEKHRLSHKEKLQKEKIIYDEEYAKDRNLLTELESKKSSLEQELALKSEECRLVTSLLLGHLTKVDSILDETISDLNSSAVYLLIEKDGGALKTKEEELNKQSLSLEVRLSVLETSLKNLLTEIQSEYQLKNEDITSNAKNDNNSENEACNGALLNSRLTEKVSLLSEVLSKVSLENAKKDGLLAARQNASKEGAKTLAQVIGMLSFSLKSENSEQTAAALSKTSISLRDELSDMNLTADRLIEELNSQNELLLNSKRIDAETKEKVLASPIFDGVNKDESFGPEILPTVLSQVSEVRQILEKIKTSQIEINNNEKTMLSKQAQITTILESKSKIHIAMIEKFSYKTIETTLLDAESKINQLCSEMSLLDEMFSKITQRLYAVKATGKQLVTISQERKSLENNCRILAPNGEARTLAITDDISFIANQTNIQLKNLMLEKSLGVSLSLAKDEDDDTPVINIQFEVDGKSGRTLPSESQRKIVGFAMDIAVMLLGVKDGFLIVDEPETGMDDKNSGKISQFLKAISNQTILITNRASAGLGQIIKTTDLHQSKEPSFMYTATTDDEAQEEAAPVKNKARRKSATAVDENSDTNHENTVIPDEGTL